MARPAKRGGGTGTRPYLFFVAFALALSLANYRLSSRLEDFVGDRPDGGGDSRHASLRGGLSDFRRTGSMGTRGSRVSARTKGDTRRYAYSPLKGERYNFTVAICAIVKDGEAYLNEWLDYHLDALGIEMAVIYDNSWNFEMETWYNNTRAHPVYGRVEVRPSRDIHDPKRQKRAYTDCILRYGRNVPEGAVNYNQDQMGLVNVTDRALPPGEGADYFALIDVDEFLVPKGRYGSLHEVLRDYVEPFDRGGALTVNWMLFGTANHTLYTPVPVLRRFQYRDEKAHGVIKTIARSSEFFSMKTPHSIVSYGNVHTTSRPGSILPSNVSKTGASDGASPSSVLLLHHYRYTSDKEYWQKKCIRKETDGSKGCSPRTGRVMTAAELEEAGLPIHIAPRVGEVRDGSAWEILAGRVPKYRVFDDTAAWGDYT